MPSGYPSIVATFTGYVQIRLSLVSWPFGFEYNKPANFCNWLNDGASFSAGTFPPFVRVALGYTLVPYEAIYGMYSTYTGGNWQNVTLPVESAVGADDSLQWAGIINDTVVYYSPSAGDVATIHFATTPLVTSAGSNTATMYAEAWPLAGQPQIIGPLPALLAGSYTRPRLIVWENNLTGWGCAIDDETGTLTAHQLWAGADLYMATNYSTQPPGTALSGGDNIILWAGDSAGTSTPYEPVIIRAVASTGAEVYRCVPHLSNPVHDLIFQSSSTEAKMGPVLTSPAGFIIPISTNDVTPPSFFLIAPDWSTYSMVNMIGADTATQAMLDAWGFVEMQTCGLQVIGAALSASTNESFWGLVDHPIEESQAFSILSVTTIPPVYSIRVSCTDCRLLWETGEELV